MTSILLADDQELVRTGLRMILTAEDDLEVVGEAVDGQQAVDLAVEHSRSTRSRIDVSLKTLTPRGRLPRIEIPRVLRADSQSY